MVSDIQKNVAKYSVNSDFSLDGKVISVLNFLENYLPEFPKNNPIKKNTNEEIINQQLLRFFYSKNPLFYFASENLDETGMNKNKPDIGVYEKIEVYDKNQMRFFDIECKRLYHPPSKSKQYVLGDTGGIQRFKDNNHGVDLPYSAMIGYVETKDFLFWQNKVNSWISDRKEHLEMLEIKKIAKLKSKHERDLQKTSIELTHFWLKMNSLDN